jgi:hypothetical protein
MMSERDGGTFLTADEGHGAQLFREPEFMSALVDWIEKSP